MTSETSTSRPGGSPSATFEVAWQRFLAADDVAVGQGIEEEWSRGRAQFLTFLVPVLDRGLRRDIGAFVDRLRDLPCLDLYPPDYWHITVKLVGFQVIKKTRPDDVLRQEVGPLLYDAERALSGQAPFEAEIGPVNAFRDAVILEVHDGGRLREMHLRLVDALSRYPHFAYDGESYLPHVSVARFVGREGLADLKQRLSGLRTEQVGTLPVRRVEFVKVWLTGDYPEFETVQPIVLGRSR